MKKIESIQVEIAVLSHNIEKMQKDIQNLTNRLMPIIRKREACIDAMDTVIIKSIPKILKNMKKEHWEYVLGTPQGAIKNQFCDLVMRKLDFHKCGYWDETKQVAITIMFEKRDPKKIIKSFGLIKKYLKPITADGGNRRDTGIKFSCDVDEEAVFYVKPSGVIHFYANRWCEKRLFSSFNEFAYWAYNIIHKHIND